MRCKMDVHLVCEGPSEAQNTALRQQRNFNPHNEQWNSHTLNWAQYFYILLNLTLSPVYGISGSVLFIETDM